MSHTYSSNLVHCVFSTKDRVNSLPENIREKLYGYLYGVARKLGTDILALGGTENHVHILLALPANRTLSETVRDFKANSSRWMNESGSFAWQHGFGAFSVSASHIAVVKDYIRNQAEHHKRRNFEEEYLTLLRKSGIEFDSKYVFG